MIIKMCEDKSLLITKYEQLYQGENNANLLTFYIPETYGDIIVGDCTLKLNYIDSNNNYHSTPLTKDEESRNGYLLYRVSVTTALTAVAGPLTLSITFRSKPDKLVLKSNSIQITIQPRGEIVDDSESSGNLPGELEALVHRVDAIEKTQPAGLELDRYSLSLKNSSGEQIGTPVTIDPEVPVVLIDEDAVVPPPPSEEEQIIKAINRRLNLIEATQAVGLSIADNQIALRNREGDAIGSAAELDSEVPVVNIDEEG